jgi:hypothetical protein
MSIALSNGHARATVLSAVWSPVDQQLVAVLMAATDKTVLKALKAELEKNNRNSCVSLTGDIQAELAGARRGYIQLSASLEKTNAQGHVMALLHWRAHDPRTVVIARPSVRDTDNATVENDYFYVVSRQGECLPSLFLERLQLGLDWALKPEWAETLLELGREAELVDCLPVGSAIESQGPYRRLLEPGSPSVLPVPIGGFQAALRVIKDQDRWGAVIGSALATGTLKL